MRNPQHITPKLPSHKHVRDLFNSSTSCKSHPWLAAGGGIRPGGGCGDTLGSGAEGQRVPTTQKRDRGSKGGSWKITELGYQGATGTGLGQWGDDSKGLKNGKNPR